MGWMSTDESDEREIDAMADEAHRLSHPNCEGCGDELCRRAGICLCGRDKAVFVGPDKLPYCMPCAEDCDDSATSQGLCVGEFINSDPMVDVRIRLIADGIMKLNESGVSVTRDQAMERARNIETSLMLTREFGVL